MVWLRKARQPPRRQLLESGPREFLDHFARAHQVARLARERIAERAKTDPEAAYLSRGSTGQLAAHPDLRIAREAEADLLTAAEVLRLTPALELQATLDWFAFLEECRRRSITGNERDGASSTCCQNDHRGVWWRNESAAILR